MKHLLLIMFAIALSAPAFAAALPPQGMVCTACHGMNGIGTKDTYPNLNGQKKAYLEKQIKAFIDGVRKDKEMSPMAMTLKGNNKAIAEIAAYYSSLK